MPNPVYKPIAELFHQVNHQLFPIRQTEKRTLINAQGAAASFWLASLTQATVNNLSKRLKVVVTRDQNQLNQLETELSFFGVDAHVFPDWETLSYDALSPHQDIVSERIHLLTHMPTSGVLLISVQTLMQRVAPPSWLIGQHFDLSVGDRFDVETERLRLAKAGYRAVDNVFEPGEFAVRGSLVDIFAMGQPFPLRLDLFDDEIESIRFFNPQTQRTLSASDITEMMTEAKSGGGTTLASLHSLPDLSAPLTQFKILPAKEFPLDEGRETFRTNFATLFPDTSSRKMELHKDVMAGIASAGLEYYQPLFFDLSVWQDEGHLFAYLPSDALFIVDAQAGEAQAQYWEQVNQRYQERCHDRDAPIVAPDLLYFAVNAFNERLKKHPRVILHEKLEAKVYAELSHSVEVDEPMLMGHLVGQEDLSGSAGSNDDSGGARGNGNAVNPADATVAIPRLQVILAQWAEATAGSGRTTLLPVLPAPSLPVDHRRPEPLSALLSHIQSLSVHHCQALLVAETAGRREILLELLRGKAQVVAVQDWQDFQEHLTDLNSQVSTRLEQPANAPTAHSAMSASALPVVYLTIAPLERGMWLPTAVSVISETQLFGRQVLQVRRRRTSEVSDEFLVRSVTELSEGSPVVHIEHGIGRYHGLMTLDVGEGAQEFIHLKYADDASIYVPVANLQLISRYSGGDPALAPLHKIGSGKWDKAKQKALEQIHDVAAELLNIQARRAAKAGIHFTVDTAQYELFASQFDFEETPDQANAIAAVIHDMKQDKPMDRLVCGDVGFGKTEVAMRAAFIAVNSGYQVAVLVPTTLLAGQHENSFLDRFADWPIRIESLSRFGGKKHQDAVLADLATGKVDIVIGTHKILQPDVKFANLGLMIVDEEHRFGVRHKERIKAMQSDIDCLSMTATPIPRTLNMALSGMRDMSIIATPPARRLAIKTFVMQKSDNLLKEAILRELLRGGQVYLLHNDIASIERMGEIIRELVPEARVGVAHGQMHERELEQVMREFYHKRHNILICTTIIETGIDVPNANTIIIERADKFGLAQLHQLRGRVGRSHHQAYCYLLVPSVKGLKGDAKRRLEAIERANTLGAGFMLASEDLEIRGAGELLGKEQSGNMQAIGFSLYMDMLERATKAIKAGKQPNLTAPLTLTSDINLHCSALIPEDYLPDVHQRLMFYKRISGAEDSKMLIDIRTEMLDRFGAMPVPTAHLFEIHCLRLLAEPLAIKKIDATTTSVTVEFDPDTPVEAMTIISLIQSQPSHYRMQGATGIRLNQPERLTTPKDRIETVKELLQFFTAKTVLKADI